MPNAQTWQERRLLKDQFDRDCNLKRSDAATDAMSGSLTKSLLDVGRGLQRVCAWKADIKWYGERDAG